MRSWYYVLIPLICLLPSCLCQAEPELQQVPHHQPPRPWQVGILHRTLRNRLCGGSILNDRFVVTAASCLANVEAADLVVSLEGGSRMMAMEKGDAADETLTSATTTPGHREHIFQVKMKLVHPEFNPDSLSSDIALLEVDEDIKHSETVGPICLPDKTNLTYVGKYATLSGFGRPPAFSGPHPMPLPPNNLVILTNEQCEMTEEKKDKICAKNEFFQFESCKADVGGSLSFDFNKQDILIGIVSSGSKNSCPSQSFGVFTRVTNFLDWIAEGTRGILTCVPYRTFKDHKHQTYILLK